MGDSLPYSSVERMLDRNESQKNFTTGNQNSLKDINHLDNSTG